MQLTLIQERERVVNGLIEDLKKTLAYNVEKIYTGGVHKPMNQMKNAVISLVVLMLGFLLKSVVASLAEDSSIIAPETARIMEIMDQMIGYIMMAVGALAIIMIVAAGIRMMTATSVGGKAIWRGKEERQKLYDQFISSLVGVIEPEEMRTFTNMVSDAYFTVQALDESPELRESAAAYYSNLFGQALLSASMIKAVNEYTDSRWQQQYNSPKLNDLNNAQSKLVGLLDEQGDQLEERVSAAKAVSSKLKVDTKKLVETNQTQKFGKLIQEADQQLKALTTGNDEIKQILYSLPETA